MKNLTAVVLAGGAGSRFWPLVTNKILFPFMGKPLFAHTIVSTLPKDVADMVIVASPENEKVLSNFDFGIPSRVVVQKDPKGMGDALGVAKGSIKMDASLLILIADDMYDSSVLEHVIEASKNADAFGIIPGWKAKQYFPGGYLKIGSAAVKGIVEKPDPDALPSQYVNISGHFIRSAEKLYQALDSVHTQNDDQYEAALTRLMSTEEFIHVPYEGEFTSLKYAWNVLDVSQMLLSKITSHRGGNFMKKEGVYIDGEVYIGDNVRIFENTKIVGPCYIGNNVIVGNNNIIRDSIIEDGCITGFSSDITRSYVGRDCWFHTNYVGDSVLEGDVSMGSGAVTANLRLDEANIHSHIKGDRVDTGRNKHGAVIGKGVRIGVNTSIMPGIKIGSGSFIGSGVILHKDLENGKFCRMHAELKITDNPYSITTTRDEFKNKI